MLLVPLSHTSAKSIKCILSEQPYGMQDKFERIFSLALHPLLTHAFRLPFISISLNVLARHSNVQPAWGVAFRLHPSGCMARFFSRQQRS